jgi:Protein of unknown function (DUF1670)
MDTNITKRNQHKTSEGEFDYELQNLYELSPKMRESIIETAKRCLIRDNILKEGQLELSVISIEERSGKFIEKMEKRRVVLTLDNGTEDRILKQEFGRIRLRQARIERLAEEAIEQQGILSQEDLGRILNCTVRTIQRDISEIKSKGIEVITRGVLHNIGRGQTHKVKIISLYLEGRTFSEIKLKTHHSVGAIKRYIQDFQKVLMSKHHGIRDAGSISNVTGLSITLVNQYLDLIEQSIKDRHKNAMMKDMIKQWNRAGTRIKKKEVTAKDYMRNLAPMIGGMR